jgi:hypothetical protein
MYGFLISASFCVYEKLRKQIKTNLGGDYNRGMLATMQVRIFGLLVCCIENITI